MLKTRHLIVASIIFLIGGLACPLVLDDYWLYVCMIALYYATMAVSWNLLAGFTGQFSLCHHVFALMGAYVSALISTKLHVPLWASLPCAVIFSMVVSFGLGVLSLRMRGIYLALTTWAFAEIVRGYIRLAYGFTGGDRGLDSPLFFNTVKPMPYFFCFLGLLAFTLILLGIIMRSRIGYYFSAIRNDEVSTRCMGVNIVRYKIFAFVISSTLAGLAGAFYGHSIGLVTPVLGEFNEMAMIVVCVVIGGMRTEAGPVVGAISIRLLMDIFRQYSEIRIVLLSAVVIVLMRFLNGGLMDLIRLSRKYLAPSRN
jgi:branched-chain amino acid transport system permease protein